MTFLFAALAFLCTPLLAWAQQPSAFVHESWTVRDGLPVNSSSQVMQSRSGYLWIATFDGLTRFDGVRFTVFNTVNSPGLPSNRIIRLYESSDTTLWLITELNQLASFRNGRFTHIRGADGITWNRKRLHEDRAGRIWLAHDRGLFVVQADALVPVAPGVITSAFTITEGADGTIWVAAKPAGVYRVRDGRADPVAGATELAGTSPMVMVASANGVVWIGTAYAFYRYDGALHVAFAPSAGDISYQVAYDSNEVYASTQAATYHVRRDGTLERLSGDVIVRVAIDAGGRTWTTKRSPGALGPATLTVDGKPAGRLPSALDSVNIISMAVDREGSIWYATTAEGLHRVKPALFTTLDEAGGPAARSVYVVASDRAGAIWTLSADRPVRIAKGRATEFPFINAWGGSAILEDRTGRLWFGDLACAGAPSQPKRSGPEAARPDQRGVAVPQMKCARHPGTPFRSTTRALHEDAAGTIWFGTEDGLYTLDADTWAKRSDIRVRAFARTHDGALWMATNGQGVFRYHGNRFAQITTRNGLPSDRVRALYVDRAAVLWIGTEGNGLARIDARAPNRIVAINSKHGLYDDGIHEILEDDFGRLWLSTNRGIFWVTVKELNDFASGRIARVRSTSYTERHGLRNREANGGSQPAGAKTPDGRLWFATQGGIAVVDPRNIAQNRVPPNVIIENITRAGEKQRDITIEYTALSLLAPENVRFRYRLSGYDDNWIDAADRRTAFYTKVPPGDYRFKVIASNDAGVWNQRGAVLPINIAPLFYETAWFKLLVLLAGVLLVIAAVRYRVRQVRVEAEAQQLRELDRAKSRFFANVSHEFRTPLTLTIGPLEDVRAQLAEQGNDDVVSRIDMALRSARRLFTLVTQVLDVAKVEAGSMKLQLRTDDLVVFTRGVVSSFEDLAHRKRISFDLAAPSEAVLAAFDADALEKVITNLLSNAFKFTPDGGRITVVVEKDDVARIRVSDNGPGIPPKDLPHVFERFYQVDESNARAQVGTGIGLALAQELVELHSGTIGVVSGATGGATFTITLPLVQQTVLAPASRGAGDDVTTLLVVDDSADMRAYVRARFEQRYRVIEAADGAEGIGRAKEELPDLIISDVMMPVANGHQLVETLRSSAETDFLPIILLTAAGDAEQRVAGLARGADDYITKPFDMRELEARVENLIASRRRLRERFAGAPVTVRQPSPRAPKLDPADQAFLDRLTRALEANLANPDFGIAELAEAVFQDRSHLFRRTRDLLGESPSELLRRVRLERAAKLLVEADDGIADIAYAVGYNSVSAFCHTFRESYGATPSTYRNANVSG